MQHACAVIISPCMASPALQYFSALSHKCYDLRRNVIGDKMCVLISLQLLSDISHSKKNSARHCHKCTFVFGVRGGAVGWGTELKVGRSRVRCPMVSLEFFIDIKVAGSIPHGGIGIFHWHNLSGRTMAQELTQPLTEKSTTNISWGLKAAGA